VEGALYTRSYFSEFGASWILDKVPMAIFFERSMIPLLFLLFFALLAVMGLFDSEKTDRLLSSPQFKASIAVIRYGPWCLIALSVLDLALGTFGSTTLAVILSVISVPVLLLLLASNLKFLIVRLRRSDLQLDRLKLAISVAVIVLGLYCVPAQLGRNFGQLDKEPATSTLSTIHLHDDPTEYRLLLSVDERLYVFPERYEGTYPPIETTAAAQVESIQYGKKSE
jgi:hypothetical protein